MAGLGLIVPSPQGSISFSSSLPPSLVCGYYNLLTICNYKFTCLNVEIITVIFRYFEKNKNVTISLGTSFTLCFVSGTGL